MSRFQKGDRVVITAKKMGDHWAPDMLKFMGKEVLVSDGFKDGSFYIYDDEEHTDWWFYDYEAELVDEYYKEIDPEFVVDDLFS